MSKKFEINIRTIMNGAGITKLIGGLDRGIRRAKAFGAAMRKGMHSAPVRILRNAVAALIGTMAAGVMQAAKFNIELARAWTMSSKGDGWFKVMRNSLRAMSAELGVAKDQLTGGLYQALSASVPEDNVLSFLNTAAKIAVADGSDVAVAVDGMTTVLNAFKIEASETEAVADQMFNTVANGKTTFAGLAQSLSTVAPIAASNGVALNEVLAAVATLTKQGTPTAQAMTQIRAAILSTNEVLGDGWSKTMKLQEAFALVSEKAGGSQVALRNLLGRVEAVQGVLGLTGNSARMAAEDLESTADAAGSVERAFQKVDQFRHWQKLWQGISGLVERTAQEADSRLAPAIAGIIEDIAKIQSNDQLWAGLGDSLDEAQQQIKNIFEYIQSEGGEGAKEIVESLGQILLGHAQNGAQEAIAILAKWIPILGKEFGQATLDVIKNQAAVEKEGEQRASQKLFGKDAPDKTSKAYWGLDPEYREESRRQMGVIRQENAEKAGLDLQGRVGVGAGDEKIATGKVRLAKASIQGEIDGNARTALEKIQREFEADMQAQKAGKVTAGWLGAEAKGYAHQQDMGQAKGLYRQQRRQEQRAESKVGQNKFQHMLGNNADVAGATASLDRERQETAEVAELIRAVQGGNTDLTQAMLAALQKVVEVQNTQAKQIATQGSQIRNGRS